MQHEPGRWRCAGHCSATVSARRKKPTANFGDQRPHSPQPVHRNGPGTRVRRPGDLCRLRNLCDRRDSAVPVRVRARSGRPLRPSLTRLVPALQVFVGMNILFSFASYGLSSYDWYFAAGLTEVVRPASAAERGFRGPPPCGNLQLCVRRFSSSRSLHSEGEPVRYIFWMSLAAIVFTRMPATPLLTIVLGRLLRRARRRRGSLRADRLDRHRRTQRGALASGRRSTNKLQLDYPRARFRSSSCPMPRPTAPTRSRGEYAGRRRGRAAPGADGAARRRP